MGDGEDPLDTHVPVVVLARDYFGHGIARSLGRLGVPIYGVYGDPRFPAARSKYWRGTFAWNMDEVSEEASVDWLLTLSRRLGTRPLLIPTDDKLCLFVDDRASELRKGFIFPDQPPGLARRVSNKQTMYFLCKEYSIPTPETVFPLSRRDVEEFVSGATFPVMLKGIDTMALRRRTGMKMVIVEDAGTLLRLYDEMETPENPNVMLQEYIPGGPESVWMFNGYFDCQSNCLFGITGRKIRQYPAYTGQTSLGVCVANQEVAQQTKDLMKHIGYRGILDIGYRYDARTGRYNLLDVNPRLGATFRLFVDTEEMDVVRVLYRDLTGQPVRIGVPREGRKWVAEPYDLLSSVTYWRDGRLSPRQWIHSFRGVEEGAWFARDDLAPFALAWLSSIRWAIDNATAGQRRGLAPNKVTQYPLEFDL